jgi:hypothetical protein
MGDAINLVKRLKQRLEVRFSSFSPLFLLTNKGGELVGGASKA